MGRNQSLNVTVRHHLIRVQYKVVFRSLHVIESPRKLSGCNLERKCVIEQGDASGFVSPIVVVKKPAEMIRMCVDLRGPNKPVVIDSFPLPHIEEPPIFGSWTLHRHIIKFASTLKAEN